MKGFIRITLVAVFIFFAAFVMAQPGGGGPGGGGDPDAPIDGGLGLLIAGGALLGIRKLNQKKGK